MLCLFVLVQYNAPNVEGFTGTGFGWLSRFGRVGKRAIVALSQTTFAKHPYQSLWVSNMYLL